MIQVGDIGRDDELQVIGRGIGEDAGGVFPHLAQEEREGQGRSHGIPVRVRMTQHYRMRGALDERHQLGNKFFPENLHACVRFTEANLQKIIAFEKSFF